MPVTVAKNFVPEHISPKWPQNELSFKEFLEKSIK